MTDPIFTARAELESWASKQARCARTREQQIAIIPMIRRVTLAHAHLPTEGTE
jgi:hypothetical protein